MRLPHTLFTHPWRGRVGEASSAARGEPGWGDVSVFETYDGPLRRKGNKVTKIKFREPPPRKQPNLPLAGGGANATSKDEGPAAGQEPR